MSTITKAGEALHGDDWKTPLANSLNLNRKTMQRYAAGEMQVNPRLWAEIIDLINDKIEDLQDAKLEILTMTKQAITINGLTIYANKAELAGRTEFYNGLTFSANPYTANAVDKNGGEYLVAWEDKDDNTDFDAPDFIWDMNLQKYIL